MECEIPISGMVGQSTYKQTLCQLPMQVYIEGVFHVLFICTVLSFCTSIACVNCTLLLIMSWFARQCVLRHQVFLFDRYNSDVK